MAAAVDAFLAALRHARIGEIERLRALILGADARLSEQVKWNAPSFGIAGDDRITFRLRPGERVELVFHRGAKARPAPGFAFEDTSGLLEWVAADRAIIRFADAAEVEAKAAALRALVPRWISATT